MVNGILLLDKPVGITSNGALQQAKRLFDAAKAGHSGSLDPIATGVLPICFGEATKFSQYLLDANKRYETTIKLGVKTTTGDSEGEVIEKRDVPKLDRETIDACLETFRGEIKQVPSMYSAIKKDGQPLYKLARQGIEVERQARDISIYSLMLSAFDETTLNLDVHCSKGTYIRSLAEDIGEVLGCGAHVIALRRTGVGAFDIADTVDFDAVSRASDGDARALDGLLRPVEEAVSAMPSVTLSTLSGAYLLQGQPVQVANAPRDGLVQLFQSSGDHDQFIGIGEVLDDGRIAPRRLLAAQT